MAEVQMTKVEIPPQLISGLDLPPKTKQSSRAGTARRSETRRINFNPGPRIWRGSREGRLFVTPPIEQNVAS